MFLTELYKKGLQYNSINVARSALSSFLKICGNMDINSYEELTRFMKGVFQSRPALPRYEETWDVNVVLEYLRSFHNTTLFQISCQLCMLFLLTSAQRCQTLHLIEIKDIQISTNRVVIYPNHLLKQSKPGQHLESMKFEKFPKDKNLCFVTVLSEYLQRTKHLRTGKKLLISTIKPHKGVSKDTVARWIRQTMDKAGIDNMFKPHSIRAASTSKAKKVGVPLQVITKTAGWANAKVFAKHYDKPIKESTKTVQEAILEGTG